MRHRTARIVAITLAAAAALGAFGAGTVVLGGLYDVSAGAPHTQAVYTLLEQTKRHSVRRAARGIDEPALDEPALARRGAACFRDHCTQCHGAPGLAPQGIGIAVQPLPGPLVDASATWRPRELAWIVRNGIRMSGMPAWGPLLADRDVWALVAFVQRLPVLSPADYRREIDAVAGERCSFTATAGTGDADPERGRALLHRHGCQGCHTIPGVVGSRRDVGPPLAGFARRTLIAGRLPNTQANVASWIRDPQRHDPATAMPSQGIGEADAHAMAAYLRTLR